MLEARASILGASGSGFNMIASDAMRLNPLNDPLHYQDRISFAAGCLLNNATRQEVPGCKQENLREPSSAIQLHGISPRLSPGLADNRTSDEIFGVFRETTLGKAGSFRTFISTRTEDEGHRGPSYTGRYGCLMAREALDAASPFTALCRLRHRLSWDTEQDDIFLLQRTCRQAPFNITTGHYIPTAPYDATHPDGDGSGIPELDGFVELKHSADGGSWTATKRVTDDPVVRHDQMMINGSFFTQRLRYIGFAMDGCSRTEDGLLGQFHFGNVLYNGTYQRLTDLVHRMQGIPPSMSGVEDRSGGLCASDITRFVTVSGSGFQRLGFLSTIYAQRVTIQNTSGKDLKGPFSLMVQGMVPNAKVRNATAVPSACATPGIPTIPIDLGPDGVFTNGETVGVDIQFENAANTQIQYQPRILGGGGRF